MWGVHHWLHTFPTRTYVRLHQRHCLQSRIWTAHQRMLGHISTLIEWKGSKSIQACESFHWREGNESGVRGRVIVVGTFGGRGSISANLKDAIFRNAGILEGEVGLHWIPAGEWYEIFGFGFVAEGIVYRRAVRVSCRQGNKKDQKYWLDREGRSAISGPDGWCNRNAYSSCWPSF